MDQAREPHLGYGVNGIGAGDLGPAGMGFDWMKDFTWPSKHPPYRTLIRLRADHGDARDADAFARTVADAIRENGGFVEAIEVGNEPNLDDAYGWGASPDAANYTALLCATYDHVKRVDPRIVVVSAGLAPTGRVPFTIDGHRGYCRRGHEWCPSDFQDEREYLREMLSAGAGECFDALGYHPYGFAAPHDAAPGSPECGPNDFCYRSVERIHEILSDEHHVAKPIWSTEFGWILDPASVGRPECRDDPSMTGRTWQFVTPEQQADYLRGAYELADERYPWMGPMFLFTYGRYSGGSCDQMGFYDVRDRPAEAALAQMEKRYRASRAVWSPAPSFVIDVGVRGAHSSSMSMSSLAPEPLGWRAAIVDTSVPLAVAPASGSQADRLGITVGPWDLPPDTTIPTGRYTSTLSLTAVGPVAAPVIADPVQHAQVAVTVTELRHAVHLPLGLARGVR